MTVVNQVVMPNTACEAGSSALYGKIGDTFPNLNLVTVQRKYFSETKGKIVTRTTTLRAFGIYNVWMYGKSRTHKTTLSRI